MNPSIISEQIERILCSQSFASKSQLRKLLKVLSKNLDTQNTLSPDVVIQELWPAEIRTKRAADVATEMNRLRHALESYYEEEGKTDPITIFLPNRGAAARNGTQEKRWIVANPRNGREAGATEDEKAESDGPQEKTHVRRGLKIISTIAAVGVLGSWPTSPFEGWLCTTSRSLGG